MAKIQFKDFMNKMGTIFSSDGYLAFNKYFIGGEESNKIDKGTYICLLSDDTTKMLQEYFKNDKIIEFTNIKKAKDNPTNTDYTKQVTDDKIISHVIDSIKSLTNDINSIQSWKPFNFTEELLEKLYDECSAIDWSPDDKKIASITISKSLFPLITSKTISEVNYNIKNLDLADKISQLTMSFDNDFFQIYMVYYYIPIEEEDEDE